MKFKNVFDMKLPGCYAAGRLVENGMEKAVFASEKEGDGKIISLDLDSFQTCVLSESPGGCMNVISLPGEDVEFLAIQRFFPVFQSENAVIVWGWKTDEGYQYKEVQQLPFVHRIEVIHYKGEDLLIAASLCGSKRYQEDWESPGSIYAGRIDYISRSITEFHVICKGIFQNHGLTRAEKNGIPGVLVSGRCGVFLLTPSKCVSGMWEKQSYIDTPASDAVIVDIDGDGQWEMGVISPFHGDRFQIYKRIGETWNVIYELPGKHEFGHAIWGGMLNGHPGFIVGYRGDAMESYLVSLENGEYKASLIDKGTGPANITVVHVNGCDYVCAANRQSDRCTVYQAYRD